jgi:hypothetical protein
MEALARSAEALGNAGAVEARSTTAAGRGEVGWGSRDVEPWSYTRPLTCRCQCLGKGKGRTWPSTHGVGKREGRRSALALVASRTAHGGKGAPMSPSRASYHVWRCLGLRHLTSQLARNILNSCIHPLHAIT